jgi:GNAT superfamily N-acetyltransferase
VERSVSDTSSAAGERAVVVLRRPVESDYPRLIEVVNEWWGGRKMRALLPRLWLQHMTGTSWIAESPEGRLRGFLIGFISSDHPETAYAHMIAADQNLRRAGVGRAMYERFFDDARARGATRVRAVTWPGNRLSVDFHRAMGFRVDDGPGTQNLYGIPAYPDYDGDGEDRVVLTRDL